MTDLLGWLALRRPRSSEIQYTAHQQVGTADDVVLL